MERLFDYISGLPLWALILIGLVFIINIYFLAMNEVNKISKEERKRGFLPKGGV